MNHKPNLIEIFRTDTSTLATAVQSLTAALKATSIGWNYIDSTLRVMAPYKGLHSLDVLTQSLASKKGTDGYRYNEEVARAACPVAFGRTTSPIKLSKPKFRYGKGRSAAFRIPFVFVEGGVVKSYTLQPRKNAPMKMDQWAGYATVVKRYLLDSEFYGERVDVELVDVSVDNPGHERTAKVYSLADVDLWTDDQLNHKFDVISEALDFIESNNLIKQVRRPLRESSMPLFGD